MMRVKYNLIYKNKSLSPVQISITWNGNRIQKNIGYSIETKYWDFKKHRLKASHSNAVKFNSHLSFLENSIIMIYNDKVEFNKDVSKNTLKKELELLINNGVREENKNKDIISVFDIFLNDYRPNGKKPANKTIEGYVNAKNKLIRYMKHHKSQLHFDDIDKDFYNNFVEYLREEKNNSDNTIGTNIKSLRTFMRWSFDNKYHNNTDYTHFKILKNEALFSLALTEDEVKRINSLKIENQELEYTRLFILVACHTGLRSSDLMEVIREQEITNNELRIFQVKTRSTVKLYINDYVVDLIKQLKAIHKDQYDKRFLNRNLETIGKLCKMNETMTSTKIVGNERQIQKKKRWELLKTHVGRRTFATRASEKGMPLHVIKKYTGHRSLDSLEKYLNASSYDDKSILENLFNLVN